MVPPEYHILNDKSTCSGRERPWQDKKIKSSFVAKSYERLGNSKKAELLNSCGTFLEFKRFSDNSLKLHSANFCKQRLCPLCAWRRSLKIFGQVSAVMNEAVKDKDCIFLFLTLTVRNCSGDDLPELLDTMMSGYKALFKTKEVRKSVLASFRALEVTHNVNRYSKSFNTYHPHFHCILMVNRSYLTRGYITQKKWVKLWQNSLDIDYLPRVHIEKINGSDKNIQKAVAEAAKYSVKDSDILNANQDLQDSAVSILDKALKNRRLVSYRGEFAKIRKRLNLDNSIEDDLVHCETPDSGIRNDLSFVIERYRWHVGYYNYLKLEDY